jgi:hypothetical protein
VFQDSGSSFLRHFALVLTTRTYPSTLVRHALMVAGELSPAAYPSPAAAARHTSSPATSGAARLGRLSAMRFLPFVEAQRVATAAPAREMAGADRYGASPHGSVAACGRGHTFGTKSCGDYTGRRARPPG